MSSIRTYCEGLSPEIKQTGKPGRVPAETILRAGKLTMIFREGALRHISAGSDELLRMIYPAVRVQDWMTVSPVVSEVVFDVSPDSFLVRYTCNYFSGEVDFTARYEFKGDNDNSLALSMEGIANKAFLKNRIGFCILHPIDNYTGVQCNISHGDGSVEESFFPEQISPHQVFRDIRSMNWQTGKVKCRINLDGDIFETEDQRNWTDASFKTYPTPLSLPYPVRLEKGARINQSIKFRAEVLQAISNSKTDKTCFKLFPEKLFRLPSVGICRRSYPSALNKEEIEMLRLLHFDHYRVDLHLFVPGWQEQAELAWDESSVLGWPVEFALFMDDNATVQINDFVNWYYGKKPLVSTVLLFHKSLPATPDSLARKVIPLLKEVNPGIKIATGTNSNFVQLNRNRPGDTGNDGICYSIQPQEHAFDDLTLVENLKAQGYTIETARKFSGNKEIIISPVTIQRRFNANQTMIELPWSGTGVPPHVDCRMMSLSGACWTAGSLKYISEAGADSVTYYYTAGERGIIQGRSDSLWPLYFKSVKGMIFPAYWVLRYFLDHKHLHLIKSISSKPLITDALVLIDDREAKVILVNYTEKAQKVQLDFFSDNISMISLDAGNFSEAASDFMWTGKNVEKPVSGNDLPELEPYSVNFIEGLLDPDFKV